MTLSGATRTSLRCCSTVLWLTWRASGECPLWCAWTGSRCVQYSGSGAFPFIELLEPSQRLTSIHNFMTGQVRTKCRRVAHSLISHTHILRFHVRRFSTCCFLFAGHSSLEFFADKDIVTKKLWWYTAPDSARSTRLVIPEAAKEEFLKRKIPCGTAYMPCRQNRVVHVLYQWFTAI